jgi:hypothetical protein
MYCYRIGWPRTRMSSDNVLTQLGGGLREEISLASTMTMSRCRAVNETVGCAFTNIRTRGYLTSLKEPCWALPRKCFYIHSSTAIVLARPDALEYAQHSPDFWTSVEQRTRGQVPPRRQRPFHSEHIIRGSELGITQRGVGLFPETCKA